MANTYVLISSNVLGTNTNSVTFSSIPATYTDLVLVLSARGARTVANDRIRVTINGSTSAIYSALSLYGSGSNDAVSQNQGANDSSYFDGNYFSTDYDTTNVFGSGEFYFPNYTASQNKPISGFNAEERASTASNLGVSAALFRSTDAISSITVQPHITVPFLTNSSFYLYGIKNS
jgi:hypothetical protein